MAGRVPRRLMAGNSRWLPSWFDLQSVAFVIFMKGFLTLFGVIALTSLTETSPRFPYGWLQIWDRWDAPHYIDIARDGYVTQDISTPNQRFWIVFYPLFPWMVRLVALALRDYVLSAQAVALVGAVASAILFQRLVELDFDRRMARSAVVFMFIFPTAYFFHAGYTESLFIALALGAVLAARSNQWIAAALLGAFASLTRLNGVLLVPVLLVEAYARYRSGGRRLRRAWLAIPFAGTGFLVYLYVNWRVWGDPFFFQKAMQQYWGRRLAWPWTGIAATFEVAVRAQPWRSQLFGTQELLFVVLGLFCCVWSWRRLRPSYALWMTLNWLLITSTGRIMSTPRYLLSFFPMFILFALLASERPLRGMLLTVWSVAFLGLFTTLYCIGQWAF